MIFSLFFLLLYVDGLDTDIGFIKKPIRPIEERSTAPPELAQHDCLWSKASRIIITPF